MKLSILSTSGILLLVVASLEAFTSPQSITRTKTTSSSLVTSTTRLVKPRSSSSSTLSSSTIVRFATIPEKGDQVDSNQKDTTSDFFNKGKPSLFDGVPYSELTIGILKEDMEGENRVSQTPDTVRNLVKEGFTVIVEKGGKFVVREKEPSIEQQGSVLNLSIYFSFVSRRSSIV